MKKTLYKIETRVVKRARRDEARKFYSGYLALKEPTAAFMQAHKKLGVSPPYEANKQVLDMKFRYKSAITGASERMVSRVLYGKTFRANATGDGGLMDAIRYIREQVQNTRRQMRNADYFHSTLHRKISTRGIGYFLKTYRNKVLKTAKVPRTKDMFVGIEIECVLPNDVDMGALIPYGKWVNVGTDGSIQCDDGGETGQEIRICVERENVRKVLPPIMDALVSMGAYVNKSCGLHVHLDQRNNPEPEKAYENLVRSLGLLYTVVPASRRDNTYCKRNRSTDFADARENGGRYKAINATAYDRYRTIEVRLFGGTLEATKVINWIETLWAIATGSTVLRCPKNFETARKYWNLSDENVAWLTERQAKFSRLNVTAPTSEYQTDVEPSETVTANDEALLSQLAEAI